MVLEAIVIAVDNSEFMRNGDYTPSRYDAQYDACNLIFGRKSDDNPESSLALISIAGDTAEVHVALTLEIGDVITALQKVKIGGKANFTQCLLKANLVLQHKRNPNQGLRIILFIGSPIYEKKEDLVTIGEKLKKNRIAVDLVSFGETELNEEKLEAFFATVNNNNNCNLVKVPIGLGISLSDYLRNTPILAGGDFQGGGGGGGGDNPMGDFGINPNTDPELYAAIQESMRTFQTQNPNDAPTTDTGSSNTNTKQNTNEASEIPGLDPDGDVPMYDDEIKKAIELSLLTGDAPKDQPNTNQPQNPDNNPNTNKDPNVPEAEDLENILMGLEGVDITDPNIQNLISNLKKDEKKDEKKDDKQ
jgi:26S proteasome regulatory subunit N10